MQQSDKMWYCCVLNLENNQNDYARCLDTILWLESLSEVGKPQIDSVSDDVLGFYLGRTIDENINSVPRLRKIEEVLLSIEKAGEETEQVKYYNSRSAFLRQFNGMRNGLNLCYYLRIQLTLSDDIVNIQYAVSSYFNIIMSVVVLVYSLVNGNARYDNRISTIKEAIDAVKREKRSLQLGNTTVEEAREKYDRIIESTEYREDIDFFVTVKLLCKKYEVSWWRIPHVSSTEVSTDQKRVMNYLHELNPYFLQCRIVFEFVGYVALIAVPIVIFGLCILAKVNSWIM